MRRIPHEAFFPFLGLSEESSLEEQRDGTTPDAQNVRSFDPVSGELKGAQRGGLSAFYPRQFEASEVQDLCHVVPQIEYNATPIDPGEATSANIAGGEIPGTGVTPFLNRFESSTWIVGADMATARRQTAASEISDKGYVFGGSGTGATQTAEEYTPDTWTTKANMPNVRSAGAAATIGTSAYVYYGATISNLNTDEYTPSTDSWDTETDSPSPRRDSLAYSAIGTAVYAYAGDGAGAGNILQDTEQYIPSTETWAGKTNMPLPVRRGCAGCTVSGKGYVFAGRNSSSTNLQDNDEYDATGDSWTSKTSLPTPQRWLLAASTIGTAGYAYGGTSGSGAADALLDTDEYTPGTDSWAAESPMPIPAMWGGAAF